MSALVNVLREVGSSDTSEQQRTHSHFPLTAYDGGSVTRMHRSVDLDLDLLQHNSGVAFPSLPR